MHGEAAAASVHIHANRANRFQLILFAKKRVVHAALGAVYLLLFRLDPIIRTVIDIMQHNTIYMDVEDL